MVLSSVSVANANSIIDTGPGDGGNSGFTLNWQNRLAANFAIDSETTLTSISGWIHWTNDRSYSTLNFSIYSNLNSLPGVELYTGSVLIPITTIQATNQVNWNTLSGINWTLDAGQYWVGFSTPDSGTMPGGVARPIIDLAYGIPPNWTSISGNYNSLGIMISGVPSAAAVPEPDSYAMLLLGFGLLGFIVHRRKSL